MTKHPTFNQCGLAYTASHMANVHNHAPGTVCWAELARTGQDAAKKFYPALLGWTPTDQPMGPGSVYTIFSLDGRNTGACYTLEPDLMKMGVPPHWLLYVTVTDADQTAAKVAPAGGKLFKEPFDVMELGRMAVIQDPRAGASPSGNRKRTPASVSKACRVRCAGPT